MPKYPSEYGNIRSYNLKKPDKIKKFGSEQAYVEVLRFCTRYRLAASFTSLKLNDYKDDRTGMAYSAVFKVFLAQTALEVYLDGFSTNITRIANLSENTYGGSALRTKLEQNKSFRPFIQKLSALHNNRQGKAVQALLDSYLANTGSVSVITISKAIRNAFSHGRLASAPAHTDADEVSAICEEIAAHVLMVLDRETTKFMNAT